VTAVAAPASVIRLASDPALMPLPLDVLTQTIGILARKGAGKSYTARRLVEELLSNHLQVAIVDPKGDWWGLRSSVDGTTPGFPILIVGGEHGDVPLESGAGQVLAEFVVQERVSVLLDLSELRKHQVATFMQAFLETVYRLKARSQLRTPMMLVIDEADAIAPQMPQENERRMLGACEDIVRRGRQRGIGCTMVSQRSAVLNKNVLTQIQILICLRTMSPQDLKALDAWIQVHGSAEQRAELFGSVSSLPVGDAWVWSPGWPTATGIFERITVAPIATFDSGATPTVGTKVVAPKTLADVDLGKLSTLLAGTIERARESDPVLLRQQITALQNQLRAAREAAPPAAPPAPAPFPVPVMEEGQLRDLHALALSVRDLGREYLAGLTVIAEQLQRIEANLETTTVVDSEHFAVWLASVPPELAPRTVHSAPRTVDGGQSTGQGGGAEPASQQTSKPAKKLRGGREPTWEGFTCDTCGQPGGRPIGDPRTTCRKCEKAAAAPPPTTTAGARVNGTTPDAVVKAGARRMVEVLAMFHPRALSPQELSTLADIVKGGTFTQYRRALVQAGLIEEPAANGAELVITAAGLAFAGAEVRGRGMTLDEVLAIWRPKLKAGARRMLDLLVGVYPRGIAKDALSEQADVVKGGTFTQYLRSLTKHSLAIEREGEIIASDTLFMGQQKKGARR
jgi:hypothetical protein